MRSMQIYRNGELAGILTEEGRTSYVFRYDDAYYHNKVMPAITCVSCKLNRAGEKGDNPNGSMSV